MALGQIGSNHAGPKQLERKKRRGGAARRALTFGGSMLRFRLTAGWQVDAAVATR